MRLVFSFKYLDKSFAQTIVTGVMSQQNQRTEGTEDELQHGAWDFAEELSGNSIDPLGSGYLQLMLELSGGDNSSALSSEDMFAGGF